MQLWNLERARHLLTRTLFGYTRTDLDQALSFTSAADFIQQRLLAEEPLPEPPGSWVSEAPVPNNPTVDGNRYRDFTFWWLQRMLSERTSMREKMVLFWHNHFTSERDKVNFPQHMYQQQALFRRFAFGNFQQLAKEVTIDPAMLIYLDGRLNNRNAPNENYARELLELFTLGIGQYTETDVKQAALALTGWRVEGLNASFNKASFADSPKTFLGKTGNFTYSDIIDIVFTKEACAEFLCRKLYKEFVYYKPNEAFVKEMAAVLRQGGYALKPLLVFLFTSEEFYRPDYRGAKIKSPTELLIGTLKALNITNPDWGYIAETGRILQQQLFNPPNVQGWVGQRDWITSTTLPQRGSFSDSLINGRRANGQRLPFMVDALAYARSFASAEKARLFVSDTTQYLLQTSLSAQKLDFMLETLLDGTTVENWSTNTPMADMRIQKFLRTLMRQPEYQLC
ncbi:DUF1800 domain-containing protein [Nibrella viscosa]|uniref:DUF1800 domain-containing protein n=1 Tax=Nibrella viscosa TaxID=1084524 RepID=A0ABP8KF44_9BACT